MSMDVRRIFKLQNNYHYVEAAKNEIRWVKNAVVSSAALLVRNNKFQNPRQNITTTGRPKDFLKV